MADYGEIFCTAVNEIVKSSLGAITYDLTKDCTIISDKNKKDSEYLVSDGSNTFKAYAAAGATYIKGDQVLVSIPQGDYSKQKTIINKIISESSSAIGYVSPLEEFIAGSGNVIHVDGPIGIAANDKGSDEAAAKLIATLSDEQENLYFGFTKIALTAEFMTLFSDSADLTRGEYGLKLLIKDASGNGTELTFSASEMLGNPYKFNTYFYQECVFTLPDSIKDISSIQLFLYQDQNFGNNKNNYTPLTETNSKGQKVVINDIFVKNINIQLGFSSSANTSELVQLNVVDSNYSAGDTTRYPTFQWFHLIDTGVFEPINISNWSEKADDGCQIRWYQYDPGCSESDTDEYGGKSWKWLNQADSLSGVPANYPFSFPIVLRENKEREQIKVVAIHVSYPYHNNTDKTQELNYTSNILEFKNTTEETEGGTQSDAQVQEDLSLFFTDNSYGNYFWYDQNGVLIDSANQGAAKSRSIEIRAKGDTLGDHWDSYKHIDWIRWEIPQDNDNTMIKAGNGESFSNPGTSILTALDSTRDNYSTPGNFNFKAKILLKNGKESLIDRIKIIVAEIKNQGKQNEKENILASTIMSSKSKDEAGNIDLDWNFKINKVYSNIKVRLEYYKEKTKIEIDSQDVTAEVALKQSSTFLTQMKSKELPSIKYSIKDNWTQNRDNNIIKCVVSVNGVEHVLTETLRFGPKGSSGTSNTFLLEMLDGKNALLNKQDENLRIQAMLIGGNGKRITLSATEMQQIEWTILNYNESHMKIEGSANGSFLKGVNSDIITLVTTWINENDVPDNNYAILQAKYKHSQKATDSGTEPDLYAFLPIPMRDQDCVGMQGATQIIYNSLGVPKYSNNAYIAFDQRGNEDREWEETQPKDEENKHINPNPVTLTSTSDVTSSVSLKASPLYAKKNNDIVQDKICVYCSGQWSQPILVMQSQYDFAMLNSWNGELTINKENGTILATMLGAGKKTENNKFSGVLIGDVRTGTGNDQVTQTGVYGFDEGVMSYALKQDGSAFFGAAANGRIEIDGEHGAIHSYGWEPNRKDGYTEWSLKNASKGSVFDLDDGQLQLYSDDSNYLKYNDKNSGKLEMALSGVNIKLNDKENNPNLSGYIDVTASGLTTEFRRTAAYYATCDSGDVKYDKTKPNQKAVKVLKLENFTEGYKTDSTTTGNVAIPNLTYNDILKKGVTIAVTFTNAQSIEVVKNITTEEVDESDSTMTTEISYSRFGVPIQLQIDGTDAKEVWVNNKVTGNIDSDSNPKTSIYGWAAGSTVYFTYAGSQGHWEVTDSGSFSKITQTADLIQSDVSTMNKTLSSTISQTAEAIRMEVRQKANYSCKCGSVKDAAIKYIEDNKTSGYDVLKEGNINKGITLTIKFEKEHKTDNAFTFTFSNDANATQYPVEGTPHWNAGETLPFIYDGQKFILSSLSESYVEETANAIMQHVKRVGGYGCIGKVDNSGVLTATLQNISGEDIVYPTTISEVEQNGVTLAVTINEHANQTLEDGTRPYPITKLKVKIDTSSSTGKNINRSNAVLNNGDNRLVYKQGDTFYFSYLNGAWYVVDSGSNSALIETADGMVAKVGSSDDDSFSWTLTKDGFILTSDGDDVFICDGAGITVDGTIKAKDGEIAGWSINTTSLTRKDYTPGQDGFIGFYTFFPQNQSATIHGHAAKNWRQIIGSNFGVDNSGQLYCSAGKIGGWDINSSSLTYGSSPGSDGAMGLYNANQSTSVTINNMSSKKWRILAGSGFGVTSTGEISAKSGNIGGWKLSQQKLYSEQTGSNGLKYCIAFSTANVGTDFRCFAIGQFSGTANTWGPTSEQSGAVFSITGKGKLTCTNADIKGKITATTGDIGGWTLSNNALTMGDHYFGPPTTLTFNSSSVSDVILRVGQHFIIDANGVIQCAGGSIRNALFTVANKIQIGNISDNRAIRVYGRSDTGDAGPTMQLSSGWYEGISTIVKIVQDSHIAGKDSWTYLCFVHGILVGVGQDFSSKEETPPIDPTEPTKPDGSRY